MNQNNTSNCASCKVLQCWHPKPEGKFPKNCTRIHYEDLVEQTMDEGFTNPEAKKLNVACERVLIEGVDDEKGAQWSRIEELIHFLDFMEYKKIGLALCTGLAKEARILNTILDLQTAGSKWALISSWSLFGLAILLTIVSYVTSQAGLKSQLQYAKKYYLERDDSYFNKSNTWATTTEWLGKIAGGAFFFAVFTMTLFVVLNISDKSGGKKMPEEKENTQQTSASQEIKEGAPIPNLQQVSGSDEEKAAPIPTMRPVENPQSPGEGQETIGAGTQNPAQSQPNDNENVSTDTDNNESKE